MGYRITVKTPSARAKPFTPREVTIEEDGSPWPIRLRFLEWTDDDGTTSWRNVSFELGQAVDDVDETTTLEELPAIDPNTLDRIAVQYPLYLRLARDMVAFDTPPGPGLKALTRSSQGRRGLTDEFLRRIGAEVDEWRRNKERNVATRISQAHQVDLSTASRWIKKATERGFVKEARP